MTLLRQDHFDVARMVDDVYQTVRSMHQCVSSFPMDEDDQANFEFFIEELLEKAEQLANFYESKVEA